MARADTMKFMNRKALIIPLPFVRWTEQRNFEAILSMMATGRLDVKPLITHRFDFEKAQEAYDQILKDSSALGVLLEYDTEKKPTSQSTIQITSPKIASTGSEECVAAMIGGR